MFQGMGIKILQHSGEVLDEDLNADENQNNPAENFCFLLESASQLSPDDAADQTADKGHRSNKGDRQDQIDPHES